MVALRKPFSYELCPGERIKTSDFSSYGNKCTGQGNRFLEVSRVVLALGGVCVWQNQAWSAEWLQGSVCLFCTVEGLVHGCVFHGGKLSLDSPMLSEFWAWVWVEPPAFSWQEGVGLLGSSPLWAELVLLGCVVGSRCPRGGTEAWGCLQTFPPDVPRSPRAVRPVMSYLGA